MGNLFSFSLPTTLVLLWACAPERAYNFQKYPRGCFSSDRRLKTVFQLSEQAINSKKHFPDWGTPPSTVQIHKTVRRRNLQTDQDRSRLPRSQMSLQRRGTRLHDGQGEWTFAFLPQLLREFPPSPTARDNSHGQRLSTLYRPCPNTATCRVVTQATITHELTA
jgi:hypothetical protein